MSTSEKKHGFHLVEPSPWPIFASFSSLVLAFGAVYYFHTKALWLLLIGTALLIYEKKKKKYTHRCSVNYLYDYFILNHFL